MCYRAENALQPSEMFLIYLEQLLTPEIMYEDTICKTNTKNIHKRFRSTQNPYDTSERVTTSRDIHRMPQNIQEALRTTQKPIFLNKTEHTRKSDNASEP